METVSLARTIAGSAPKPDFSDNDGLVGLLQQACLPTALPLADARALARIGQAHRVAAGNSLWHQAPDEPALWLVASGCVTAGGVDGKAPPLRSLHRGQWLDAASAWLRQPVQERCVADIDSKLYAFPIDEVEALCQHQPTLARALLGLLASHVRGSMRAAHNLLTKDTLARSADWLLEALHEANDGATVVLAERKSVVASQIGTSPATFSRMLRRLREMGAIDVKGARIRVLDERALQRLATA